MEELIKHADNLVTIPYIDCSTLSMVANYYGVPKTTIKGRYAMYRDELDKVGVMTVSAKEVEGLFPATAVFKKRPGRGIVSYNFEDGQSVSLSCNKNWLFTKEAVDYIGTTLASRPKPGRKKKCETSDVKKMSVAKKSSTKFRSEEEKKLCINLAKAFASGDTLKLISAALDLDSYRLEQISDLSDKVKNSVSDDDTEIPWTSRVAFTKIMRTISDAVNVGKSDLVNKVYYKLIHEYKIPLEERKIMPLIDAVKDSEWHMIYQAISDICSEHLLDIRQVFKKSGINDYGLSLMIDV